MADDNRYIRDLALDIGEAKFRISRGRADWDERKDGAHSGEDPDAHCLPQGVPKIGYVSYPWKLVETPTASRYCRDIHFLAADLHGRPHGGPERQARVDGLLDRPLGRRLARRETTGFNGKPWLDQLGRPTTDSCA